METTKPKYGSATVGYGKPEQKEVPIQDYVRSVYKDNRIVSCVKLEGDNGYVISVENIGSSGRNPTNNMWLSDESLLALLANSMLYFEIKKVNIIDALKAMTEGKEIQYSISDNLTPIEKS